MTEKPNTLGNLSGSVRTSRTAAGLMGGVAYFAATVFGAVKWQPGLAAVVAIAFTHLALLRVNARTTDNSLKKVESRNDEQRRRRSLAIAVSLGVMVLIFYAATLIRMGGALGG